MADSADWSDGNLKVVCELFDEQVRTNNRSGSHLNKQRYLTVIEKFKQRTDISYTKMQFKNKWDKLKKEYTNWKQFTKETGQIGTLQRKHMRPQIGGGRKQTK